MIHDGERKFPSVVENTGGPVAYVKNTAFENWGETIKNAPSVSPPLRSYLIGDHFHSQKRRGSEEYRQVCEARQRVRVSGYRYTPYPLYKPLISSEKTFIYRNILR